MAPAEQQYGYSLHELGYKVNEDGLIRDVFENKPFQFFDTQNEDQNARRKEAIHTAVREVVVDELKKFDIVELHTTGIYVYKERPEQPHVTLLATDPGKLKCKREVIVIIGESGGGGAGQDAGIWAYRSLMRDGGLDGASAVGLAKKLEEYGKKRATTKDPEGEKAIPGVVIFNPGQLLYSHEENKPMTQTTWVGRPKETSLTSVYEVEDEWNKVPLHATQNRHIHNTLEHILPQLLGTRARVHMACIGDSVKDTIDCLDWLFYRQPNDKNLVSKLTSIALIEPDHPHDAIQSTKLRDFLAKNGRSWVEDKADVGTLVALPKELQPEVVEVKVDKNGKVVEEDETWEKVEDPEPAITNSNDSSFDKFINSTNPHGDFLDDEDFINVPAATPKQVSCPTFSAGNHNGITELIFPAMLDDILGFFWEPKEATSIAEDRKEEKKKDKRPGTYEDLVRDNRGPYASPSLALNPVENWKFFLMVAVGNLLIPH